MNHTHEGTVLTVGCDACISAAKASMRSTRDTEGLSAGQRLTLRNRQMLEAGRHPATGAALDPANRCGDCTHHHAYGWHGKAYHKCELHRLGESHSEASDIRVSWPACSHFEAGS